jgi:hypothetical protein
MKKHVFALVLLCAVATASSAQLYKSFLPSPQFTKALETIVLDFRLDYKNIQGSLVESLGQVDTYESTVKIPGSANCRILRFHSAMDTTACFQAMVYSGDDYKEAVRAYENTVRLVKKSNMHWVDRSIISFKGELVAAREDLRFTTSRLMLTLDDERYKGFKAEIELVATQLDHWEVQLNLSKEIDVMAELQ